MIQALHSCDLYIKLCLVLRLKKKKEVKMCVIVRVVKIVQGVWSPKCQGCKIMDVKFMKYYGGTSGWQ